MTDRWLLLCCFRSAAQLGKDFVLAENQVFLALDLDFAATVLAEEHAITNFDVERNAFALLALAGADGDDLALLRLFLRGVRDDDATLDGFLLFNTLHDNAIVERCKIDCHRRKTSISELAVEQKTYRGGESR